MNAACKSGHIATLDGFRAIAVIIVIASHGGLNQILPGQFGVTLFFFLSGYLITTLMRKELAERKGFDFRRFYLRRSIRILPPMYVTILFASLLSLLGLIGPINFTYLYVDALFLTNYLPLSAIPIGLWSLAVEEHFYLLFPAALFMLHKRLSFQKCAAVFAIICLAVLAIRFWEVGRRADFTDVNFWTHTRIDSILFGSILALWNNPASDEDSHLPTGIAAYAGGAAFLLISFVIRDEAFRQTLRYSVQGCGLMLIFNAAIRDRTVVRALLENAGTRFIASHSYALYLVHVILFALFKPLEPVVGKAGSATLAVGTSMLFAMAMNRFVERPLSAWRRRVEDRMQGPQLQFA